MMTINEVSKLAGVSIRTLQYYDNIGLLKPAKYSESGYRLYDDAAIERLQQILLFKELEFPLKEIKEIINSKDFDRNKALEQQIELLTLKKEYLENLIVFARGIKLLGAKNMDFKAFDTSKIDEYTEKARKQWGDTEAYKEYEEKTANMSCDDKRSVLDGLSEIFIDFGKIREQSPASDEAQALVKRLQTYISENFYNCTDEILLGLGKMYASGGEFTVNIDASAGVGTAAFVSKAIEVHCGTAEI